MRRARTMSVAIGLAVLLLGCSSGDSPRPVFRYDLRAHGLIAEAKGSSIGSYNQIAFLNDDLLLVNVNQRIRYERVEQALVDLPPSKLLLFDIKRQALVRSAEMPIEKDRYAVQSLSDTRFAIRNESGIQICDVSLVCRQPMTVPEGRLIASPAGTSLTIGGYGDDGQVLVDSGSLKELDRFPKDDPQVVPGDGVSLLRYRNSRQLFAKETGKSTRALPFSDNGGIGLPDSRFLSKETIGVHESVDTLLVAHLNGTSLYRIPVHSWYCGTAIVSSAAGSRFGIAESDYTQWNSVMNFFDIESTRPYNFERIRVLEVLSGKTLFQLEHDPRPYFKQLTLPALTPDGQHLAIISSRFLEVYEIP